MIAYRYQNLRKLMVGSWCPSLGYTGDLLLDRIGNNHGTLTNMDPATDWVASSGAGRGGYALDFDGSNDYVSLPAITLAFPFSMSCWFNVANITQNHTLFTLADSTRTDRYFGLSARGGQAGDPLSFFARNTTYVGADSSIAYVANQWNHALAIAYSATLREVYLNGALVGNSTTSVSLPVYDNLAIGMLRRSTLTEPALGQIDSINLFSTALTACDIATLARYRGVEHEVYRVPIVRGASVSGGAFKAQFAAGSNVVLGV